MSQPTIPVFDGHNDFLLRLIAPGAEPDAIWQPREPAKGHIDLHRMRAGGMVGGLFAVYVPSPAADLPPDIDSLMQVVPYDLPLPPPVPQDRARDITLAMFGALHRQARTAPDTLAICTSTAQIRAAVARNAVAAVLHMEGAEAIDPDLDALHLLHALGLRSLGPVWSRPTIFGHGVPFRFPGAPDTGPGLTAAGERLVQACNDLKIMIDLSHMNQQGFDDVARLSQAPLVATHSNAHAICPSTRNLTDRQLAMIRDSGGLVGLNFAVAFLDPAGRRHPGLGWDPILRHMDHLITHLGEDHVALGSDFDGAMVPDVIGDAAGLPRLMQALRAHGYDDALLQKIGMGNWMALLARTWGEDQSAA
jgi:membrane dipeptidase